MYVVLMLASRELYLTFDFHVSRWRRVDVHNASAIVAEGTFKSECN